jgi:zinc protease
MGTLERSKVVLKPTNLKADEILFQAISPGGTSLASDANYIPASSAVNLVTAGGLGKFNLVDLRKTLTGKVASARPFISELQEGVTGSASRKDLETMFQLIYLTFTEPRLDRDAFTVQATQAKTILANQAADPEFAFSKALSERCIRTILEDSRRPLKLSRNGISISPSRFTKNVLLMRAASRSSSSEISICP